MVSKLNPQGFEVPDPNPMVRPIGLRQEETLAEKIKRMVRSELSEAAARNSQETFEESDDFDVGDDPELASPYELSDDQLFEAYGVNDDKQRASTSRQSTSGPSPVEERGRVDASANAAVHSGPSGSGEPAAPANG